MYFSRKQLSELVMLDLSPEDNASIQLQIDDVRQILPPGLSDFETVVAVRGFSYISTFLPDHSLYSTRHGMRKLLERILHYFSSSETLQVGLSKSGTGAV